MANITKADGTSIQTLEELNELLGAGKAVKVSYDTAFNGVQEVTLKWKPEGHKFGMPAIYLHGVPARNLTQVKEYIDGDAHDRSKVQFMTGSNFKDIF